MKKLVCNFRILAPRVLVAGATPPSAIVRTTIGQLCKMAGVPMRVTGGAQREIVCVPGDSHLYTDDAYYVGVGESWSPSRAAALRVLEVLAHGFHDYAARENVCGRGLFTAPKPLGRPLAGPRPRTAAQRMAAMRARNRASAT